MIANFVKRLIPASHATKEVSVAELWSVRWLSRYGEFAGNTRQEAEFFPIEQDAKDFKQSLEQAFSLLRHTSGAHVVIARET